MVGPFRKSGNTGGKPAARSPRARLVRWGRRLAMGMTATLVAVILVLGVILLLPPVRGTLLNWGLGFADQALPGRLTVGEARWPGPGHLVFEDILWVSGSVQAPGDTLADVALIDLEIDLAALRGRDGRVRSLLVEARSVDVPGLVAATAAAPDTAAPDTMNLDHSTGEIPWLHQGSLPGVPSVALDALDLKVALLRVAPGIRVRELDLKAGADAGAGDKASVVVDHLGASLLVDVADTLGAPVWEVDVEHLGFGLKIGAEGDPQGRWRLGSADLDSLRLEVAPTDHPRLRAIRGGADPVHLQAKANVRREAEVYTGHLAGDFILPGSARFHPWLPEGFPHHEFTSVTGHLDLAGSYREEEARADLRLDLGSGSWLDAGVVDLAASVDLEALQEGWGDAVSVALDTLKVQLDGIRVSGSGGWTPPVADVALDLQLTDLGLPALFLSSVRPDLADLVTAAEEVDLDLSLDFVREGDRYSGDLDGAFQLPDARRFKQWLPPDFPHEDFTSVTGRLGLTGQYEEDVARADLRLDLGSGRNRHMVLVGMRAEAGIPALQEDWIEALTVEVDTLGIRLEGIDVAARGGWGPPEAAVALDLHLTDFGLPAMFLSSVRPDLADLADLAKEADEAEVELSVALDRQGDLYSGDLDCAFALPGASHFRRFLPPDFPHEEFEDLDGRLEFTGRYEPGRAAGEIRLDLEDNAWAERGLLAGAAELDLARLDSLGLRAVKARLDTLEFDLTGLSLSSRGALEPGLLDLDFQGAVTDFSLPGYFVGPENSFEEIGLEIDLALGGSLEDPEVDVSLQGGFSRPDLVVPELAFVLAGDRRDLEAQLAAGGGLVLPGTALDSLRAEVRGSAVSLDSLEAGFGLSVWQGDNYVALGGSARGDSVRAVRIDSLVTRTFNHTMRTRAPFTFSLGPGEGVFEMTQLEFVGEPGKVAAMGFWNENERDLEATIDLLLRENLLQKILPSPLWSVNGGSDLKVDMQADLEGSQTDPRVSGSLSVGLLPHREDPPLGTDLEFTAQGGPEALLGAELRVTSADSVLLRAHLDWPGKSGPEGGFWRPDPGRHLTLTVPEQKLDLDRINSRLPAETVVRGVVDFAADITVFPPGKGEKPDSLAVIPLRGEVDAQMGIPELRIDLPNRSWLRTKVDAQVQGTLADPKVTAKVDVTSGFIRIPEIPRNLLPVQGPSYLWALNDSLLAAADTALADSLGLGPSQPLLVFRAPDQDGPALAGSQPVALPALDVRVAITDDIRIIGYGVDIKLLGQVAVTRGYDEDNLPGPSMKGDLKVREGSLKAMNRVFTVERGSIKFTGSVPPDPHFDLLLESQVNNYLVRILIAGRASAPVIQLTSEPDLGEEDIMAVLLFGQPMGDLDNDQRGRMQEENDPSKELQKNMAGLAMAFGARGLQEGMSDSFGVDVVQMGSDSSGGSTLMVGKFITPDIMLKYHQSLEKSGTYFMTLEYALNRYFKLVSTYGQGEEASGGELQWSRRY